MSQVKIKLSDCWDECPVAYKNMVYSSNSQNFETEESYLDHIRDIKQELRKSGARYLIESDTIIFPTEASYTAWLLKWE